MGPPPIPHRPLPCVRLWQLLVLPVAVALLHLWMAAWLGEPESDWICLDCGARMTERSHRAFGVIRVGRSRSVRPTEASRYVVGRAGADHHAHRWVPTKVKDDDGAGYRLGLGTYYRGGISVGSSLRGACADDVVTEWDEQTSGLLARLARRDPEDVCALVAYLFDPGGEEFANGRASVQGSTWSELRTRLYSASRGAEAGSAGDADFASLFGDIVTPAEWKAIKRSTRAATLHPP